jgi:hypothetical protein
MFQHKRILLAAITPLMIFSLAPAVFGGNEPVRPGQPAAPASKTTPTQVPVMDRPEMAAFKRIQVNAVKYRQKLSNLGVILDQAKRVNAVTEGNYKKLRQELDKLLENEPAMARGGWKDSDIADFDKQIEAYKANYEKLTVKDEPMPQIPESVLKGIKKGATPPAPQVKPSSETKTIPKR